LPIAFQFIFQLAVPFRIFAAVLRAGAVAETISGFDFVIGRFAARRNAFFAGGLFDGVGNLLVGVRLFCAQVMFGLIPIAFERGFGAFPRRIIFFGPPVWIFVFGS
jgi:hypothetical protein